MNAHNKLEQNLSTEARTGKGGEREEGRGERVKDKEAQLQ